MSDEHDPRFWHPISGVNPPPAGHQPTPGVNPPFVPSGDRPASRGEVIEHHQNNGTIDGDTVRDYLGLERVRHRGRGGR